MAKNLSLRGKNVLFYNLLLEALNLSSEKDVDIQTIKKACTPQVVREIHSNILSVWPNEDDLGRIFSEEAKSESALYTGHYEPSSIIRGINRHSLYSNKIYIIDPFTDPRAVRPEYNPLYHPDAHIENTLKDLRLWIVLYPWIESGLVNFIKNPCDFNPKLNYECVTEARNRVKKHPGLEKYAKDTPPEILEEMKEYYFISNPDSKIKYILKEKDKDITDAEIDKFIALVHKKREDHPFFMPFIDDEVNQFRSPLLALKTGGNFEMVKLIASAINSHLITDMSFRWKEIETDHSDLMIKQEHWNSFSKAFQKVDINFLNNANLEYALQLRQENHLSEIRNFLSRLWRSCSKDNLFDEKNIKVLEEELIHHLKEAEIEWADIEKKFISNFGKTASAIVVSAPLIAKGSAEYLIGSLAINGLTNLGVMWHDKHSFPKKYPASFFLKMKK